MQLQENTSRGVQLQTLLRMREMAGVLPVPRTKTLP